MQVVKIEGLNNKAIAGSFYSFGEFLFSFTLSLTQFRAFMNLPDSTEFYLHQEIGYVVRGIL